MTIERMRNGQDQVPGRILFWGAFVLGGVVLGLVATRFPDTLLRIALMTAGLTLYLSLIGISVRRLLFRRRTQRDLALIADFVMKDTVPAFVTGNLGEVIMANPAATRRYGAVDGRDIGLAAVLKGELGNSPQLVYRLQSRALSDGWTNEDLVGKSGHMRISARKTGRDVTLWRVDAGVGPGTGDQSTSGVVPMLTVGRSGAILFMNDAARKLVGGRPKSLDRLFVDMPPRPGQPNRITTDQGARDVLLAEKEGGQGRQELYLLPIAGAAVPESRKMDFFQLPVPLLKLAPSGEVLAENAEARRLLGGADRTGQRIGQFTEGLGRPMAHWLAEATEGRGSHRSEFLRVTGTERETFVQITLNRTTEDGQVVLVAVLTDATELKTLEAQFVQSQKMQAIGQLAGGVAHDFNNLLTAISGHCDLLLLRHQSDDLDYADLDQINQNANRAAALVSQLLAFSRKQTLQPEVLDLRDTLSELSYLLNRLVGEKVTLSVNCDPVLAAVRADKRQLEQVIMNLVVNARDAMPRGGEIRIETENMVLDKPLARDRAEVPPGNYVCIRVSDQGIGIAPDKLTKIFEPFYTTKQTGEGTGLGLSTAYGIVNQTGGFIFVDSVPGAGACFTLYLPAHREVEGAQDKRPIVALPEDLPERSDGVVLLVEDETPVRAFAARALRLRGFTVHEAESAEAALRMLEDTALKIDVFVTDVVMPGMDGPSWVREALKVRPGTHVVFVSGYAEETFGAEQADIPNSVFLPKPFSLRELTSTVQRQVA